KDREHALGELPGAAAPGRAVRGRADHRGADKLALRPRGGFWIQPRLTLLQAMPGPAPRPATPRRRVVDQVFPTPVAGVPGTRPALQMTKPIQRDFTLEPDDTERLANLAGPFDQHLRQIELRLGVEIANRGNVFRVGGEADAVSRA